MSNKAIFIDRDGVLNRNTHYLNSPEQFELLPLVPEAIKIFKELGYKIFVVTNQGGIEKGFISEKQLADIHKKMLSLLPEIDDIRYCPDYDSFDRKPNPGMIYDLALEHEIYLSESIMIGDFISDVIAGRRAGCRTYFIMNDIMQSMKYTNHEDIDYMAESLIDVAKHLMEKEGFTTG